MTFRSAGPITPYHLTTSNVAGRTHHHDTHVQSGQRLPFGTLKAHKRYCMYKLMRKSGRLVRKSVRKSGRCDDWTVCIGSPLRRTWRVNATEHPHTTPTPTYPVYSPARDRYHCLDDALRNRQFRFQDITGTATGSSSSISSGKQGEAGTGSGSGSGRADGGPADGSGERLLYRISHEVRSLHHPLYARPLYNRELGFM